MIRTGEVFRDDFNTWNASNYHVEVTASGGGVIIYNYTHEEVDMLSYYTHEEVGYIMSYYTHQ